MSQNYGNYAGQQQQMTQQQQHMMTQQQGGAGMFPQQAAPNNQFGMRQDYQQRNIRPPYLQVCSRPKVWCSFMGEEDSLLKSINILDTFVIIYGQSFINTTLLKTN